MRLMAFALVALLLSGCGTQESPATTSAPAVVQDPALQGVVIDDGIRPLANVTVRVQDTNETTITDADGRYRFEALPLERVLVLVATKDGYLPDARQITLALATPMRLDFTLEAVPVLQPRSQVLPFEGFIACQATVEVAEEPRHLDCSGGAPDASSWEFNAEADLAGLIVEILWEPSQPSAAFLGARLETIGFGAHDTVLVEVIGESPLRLAIPQSTAERYYSSGGTLRLSVYAHPDNDSHETGAGSAVALQQDFRVFASLFYVRPPHPTYTVVEG